MSLLGTVEHTDEFIMLYYKQTMQTKPRVRAERKVFNDRVHEQHL